MKLVHLRSLTRRCAIWSSQILHNAFIERHYIMMRLVGEAAALLSSSAVAESRGVDEIGEWAPQAAGR